MSGYLSSEEVKQEHIRKLGDNLGSLFHALWVEVAWLNVKWHEYVELFGKTPSRIDLLNKSAPLFFKIVQDSLWEEVLLHIARLTDPPKSAGYDNLTIRRLSGIVNQEVEGIISKQIDKAVNSSNFCRDWRNRHIAHRDLKLAMDEQPKQLEPASRAKVRKALEDIAKVLNVISENYMNSTIDFDLMSEPGGAEDLILVLDDGIKEYDKRR